MKPLVSVIIVSYNTRDLTVKSILSVLSSTSFKSGEIEIIVVDNHSSDDTVIYLQKNLPQVNLITNKANNGFGAGNNQGIAYAKGDYILLLNSDAFLQKDTLYHLLSTLKTHDDLISVGPQYRYNDGSLQPSAGYFPTLSRLIAWMWWLDKLPLIKNFFSKPYHVYNLFWYKKPHDPDWLMGACVLFRKKELQSVGGFDEKMFMYGEEIELYARLSHQLGKKNSFTPKTWITHIGSASTQKANASRLLLELKGIYYIYQKESPSLLWFIRFVLYTGVMMRYIIFRFLPKKQEALSAYKQFLTSPL